MVCFLKEQVQRHKGLGTFQCESNHLSAFVMTPEKNILVNRKFDGAQEKADVRLITETGQERSVASSSKETRSFVVHGGGVERLAPVEGLAPSRGGRSGRRTRLLGHTGSKRGDVSTSLVKLFELHFLIQLSS